MNASSPTLGFGQAFMMQRCSSYLSIGRRANHPQHLTCTCEVAPEGHYKLHGDAVLHFQFEGISEVHVEGFNGQNVISSLNLELAQAQDKQAQTVIKVELEHCYLFEASFTAQRAQLISITPYAK